MAKEPTKKTPDPKKEEAIPLHKKLAMGQNPKTGADSGPKTPA